MYWPCEYAVQHGESDNSDNKMCLDSGKGQKSISDSFIVDSEPEFTLNQCHVHNTIMFFRHS